MVYIISIIFFFKHKNLLLLKLTVNNYKVLTK